MEPSSASGCGPVRGADVAPSTPPVPMRSLNGPGGPVTVGFGEAWQQVGGGKGVNEKHIKIQKCAYKISPLVYCLSQ